MRTLGIQIDGPHLKAAIVESEQKKLKIRALKTASIADPANVKELYIPSFSGRSSSGISSKNLIIRRLQINLPKSRHLEEALAFQSEASSHLKHEEVILVPYVTSQQGATTEATLFIATRDSIREVLSELEKLGLDPDCLSVSPQALLHYALWKEPGLQDAFLIHLGFKEWTCALVEKGHLKKSHAILGGNEALLSALWEDRKKILLHKEVEGVAKQIDLLQLKSHLNPHLSKTLSEMRMELAKTLFSFHREGGGKPHFFAGCTDTFVNYCDFLSENFKEVSATELAIKATNEELKYAIPIGLGIEQTKKNPLQMRRDEFFPKKNWKRAGLYALGLIFTSLLMSGSLVALGQQIFSSRNDAMKRELGVILEKNDPQLRQKIFSHSDVLRDWANTVDLYSKEYPFISKAPKVAEFLSWITAHPLLERLKGEGSPIVIRDLSYQLQQYPHIGALEEPYRVKVEIEFETESPMSARKFHQALLKGDERVDPRQEIGWESLNNNSYRASFFLKNRSPYVP